MAVERLSAHLELPPDLQQEPGVVLGYLTGRRIASDRLRIGPGAYLRSGTVVYAGTVIGAGLQTGHNVVIREENEIGDEFNIWNNSTVDYGCRLGHRVKIHCNCYVAQFTVLEDDVFLGPGVIATNDPHPGCPQFRQCMRGPTLRRGAKIGGNTTLLPFVEIGAGSLIGAGSVVTRDIPPGVLAYGNPARVVKRVEELTCEFGFREGPYRDV